MSFFAKLDQFAPKVVKRDVLDNHRKQCPRIFVVFILNETFIQGREKIIRKALPINFRVKAPVRVEAKGRIFACTGLVL